MMLFYARLYSLSTVIPNVLVETSPSDTVVEGNSVVINCIHDSNDKDATIRWTPECHETLEASAQCRIDSVKRTMQGHTLVKSIAKSEEFKTELLLIYCVSALIIHILKGLQTLSLLE
ncbi:Hypothetical predicted protein [Mytilus galloprovincialis]|uniref:Ig-like domain-containing protein n=1 Tax=Mytilus galloprovincialis TaxID=29158 RepID=A0A8B6F3L2_MYTGA|nr:Hypothetical predicted protein [Mytilus galloprovincialis]